MTGYGDPWFSAGDVLWCHDCETVMFGAYVIQERAAWESRSGALWSHRCPICDDPLGLFGPMGTVPRFPRKGDYRRPADYEAAGAHWRRELVQSICLPLHAANRDCLPGGECSSVPCELLSAAAQDAAAAIRAAGV